MEIISTQPIKFESKQEQMGIVKTLTKIKTFLTPKRWTQGVYNLDNKQFCLVGAAEKIDGFFEASVREIMEHESFIRGYEATESFNDHKNRKYPQIINFLDSCLKRAEKGRVVVSE